MEGGRLVVASGPGDHKGDSNPGNASMRDAVSVLSDWSNFLVIAGSSAAGLTGLMFVVIALVAGLERREQTSDGIATFSTPTVVHFSVALIIAASLSAPWRSLVDAGILIGLIGAFGVVYVLFTALKTTRQQVYVTRFEDWVWYTLLPLLAYVAVVANAFLLPSFPTKALFALAGAMLLLIVTGIHNAWDIVTYIALFGLDPSPESTSTKATGRAAKR